ncbi:MAG: energy transducer TonB [Pseudomonadota bacterium]|nr:energy transducer TonB [Pseudomonadota bacterium]
MKPAIAGSPQLWVDTAHETSSPSVLVAAALAACGLHLLVILGVGFEPPEARSGKRTTRPLEVVVLRQAAPSDEKPEVAEAVAQVDRQGGGTDDAQDAAAKPSVEPAPEPLDLGPEMAPPEPVPPPVPEPAAAIEPPPPVPIIEDTTLTATLPPLDSDLEAPAPEMSPEPPEEPLPDLKQPAPEVTAAQIVASRNLEIAKLTAQLDEKTTAYAMRPRRKAINASTREYKYASYLEAWRRKVERIGNLNYPDEAKRRKLYGNLILHVAVQADGNIARIRVLRSSGYDVLDEAAIRIVELAAPFAPFPPDIQAETDILDITRTWQFLNSNRLGWEN